MIVTNDVIREPLWSKPRLLQKRDVFSIIVQLPEEAHNCIGDTKCFNYDTVPDGKAFEINKINQSEIHLNNNSNEHFKDLLIRFKLSLAQYDIDGDKITDQINTDSSSYLDVKFDLAPEESKTIKLSKIKEGQL